MAFHNYLFFVALISSTLALNPHYNREHCNQEEAIRSSISLVHDWSSRLNSGDIDFMIKNFIAEDSLLFFVDDESRCLYQPIGLDVSIIAAFSDAQRMELVIKNVKWYEWQACTPSIPSSSSSCSSRDHNKPASDAKDGDVVISAVGFISVDGMNPSLYNVLFYLRPECGCDYKVYRQVITPYECLAKIAGNSNNCGE